MERGNWMGKDSFGRLGYQRKNPVEDRVWRIIFI
jgi:hypothetical protein